MYYQKTKNVKKLPDIYILNQVDFVRTIRSVNKKCQNHSFRVENWSTVAENIHIQILHIQSAPACVCMCAGELVIF